MAEGSKTDTGGVRGLISALGKFMRGIKEYNIFELLKVLFAVFCIVLAVTFVLKPELFVDKISYIIESRENRLEREHASEMYRRDIADRNIRGYLKELARASGADRAWLLEPHNGKSNSTSGLTFSYLDMTGDEPNPDRDDVTYLNRNEFCDIPASEYPMASVIYRRGRWWGPLDSMERVDRKLYYKLKAQGVNECAVMAAFNKERPVCMVGLTWYGGHRMDAELTGDLIHKYTMQIALELMTLN